MSSGHYSALKKRYNLPLIFPVQAVDLKPTLPLTSSTDTDAGSRRTTLSPVKTPSGGVPGSEAEGILFNPVRIARRAEGWDTTLRTVVTAWMERVVKEMAPE